MPLTDEQLDVLRKPLNSRRVASRRGDGKTLSYLEAWDVKAHLTRIFGYGAWDAETHDARVLFEREYIREDYKGSGDQRRKVGETAMVEVSFSAMCTLTIRDKDGQQVCRYTEGACGSATVTAKSGARGDAYDNALKQAESDALKRCAINLGTQFGLSLYDNGSKADVIRWTVEPKWPTGDLTDDQRDSLTTSVGMTEGAAT